MKLKLLIKKTKKLLVKNEENQWLYNSTSYSAN